MDIISTGQMKAQSISIQVSNRTRCNGSCKFCISRTTPNTSGLDDEETTFCRIGDVVKGLTYAKRLGATHAILTGKAEPTQEPVRKLVGLIRTCRSHDFLVDMHTNGFLLSKSYQQEAEYEEKLRIEPLLDKLVVGGLTMITLSIAHYDPKINQELMGLKIDYETLIRKAAGLGLLVRCSLVLAKSGVYEYNEAAKYIIHMGSLGAHMVVMRELWVPSTFDGKDKGIFEWNKKNHVSLFHIEGGFRDAALKKRNIDCPIYQLNPLPWGAKVYAMEGCFDDPEHGVNITFAKCDENDAGPVLKSIVHKPNGHGYRNWDFNANILY